MKINNTIYTQAREVSEATRTLIKGLKYVKRILGGRNGDTHVLAKPTFLPSGNKHQLGTVC